MSQPDFLWSSFTGNERLNAPRRFVGRPGCPSHLEGYPNNTRTVCLDRMSGPAGCRVFRPESPPPRYLVPTGEGTFLRKLQPEFGLPSQPLTLSQPDHRRVSKIDPDQACH